MNEELKHESAVDQQDGEITYANEVISTIVHVVTTEVEGISAISGGSSISGIIGRGRAPRGIKVDMDANHVNVDVSVVVDYGIPIQKVGKNCQESIRKSIETMTGLQVDRVNLHVVAVSFEKENQELEQSQQYALALDSEEPTEEASKVTAQVNDESTVAEGASEEIPAQSNEAEMSSEEISEPDDERPEEDQGREE